MSRVVRPFLLLATTIALAGCAAGGGSGVEPSALTAVEETLAALDPQSPGAVAADDAMAAVPNPSLAVSEAVGAPRKAMVPFSNRLQERAREMGVALAPPGAAPQLTMKGYFSAITEGPRTTVIYVWDIMDRQGNRVHRIQGQERSQTGRGEGWENVDAAMMERVADATVNQYAAWLLSRAG